MNFLGLISLFVVLTIYFALFKTGHVTSMVIEDVNKNASLMNCSLNFISEKEHRLFNITIKKNRLIKLSMKLTWTNIPQNASQNNIDITKSSWFLATEDAGKDLLLLDEGFEVMSLGTLAISVGDVALTLNQIPENCLGEMSNHQAIETISGFLLKSVLPESENDENYEDQADTFYVCNGTITGYGLCCSFNGQGIVTCLKLEQNKWTETFLVFVWILYLFIFCQMGKLIPKSLYYDRYAEKRKVHIPIKLKIERTGPPTHRRLVKIVGKDNFENCKSHETCYTDANLVANAVYLFLDDGRFESQASNTSAINNVFHDCVQMFNDIFCKCNKDDSDLEGLKECCYYDLIHLCYIYLLKIILVLILSSPFVIRLVFLNVFKESDTNLKTRLQWNYGFISYCLFVSFLTVLFVTSRFRKLKELKSLLKQNLRKIMNKTLTENINTGMHNATDTVNDFFRRSNSILYEVRFSRLSLVKAWLTIILLCLPVSLLRFCFQICITAFPTLNLLTWTVFEVFRLYYPRLNVGHCKCLKYCAFFSLYYFVTFASSAFIYLCADAAVFLAKCCLYVMIGCLLNFDNLLVYFSFFVMIATYIFQSIRDVNTKIRNFNKDIINALSTMLVESQETINGSIVVKRDGIFFSTRDLLYFFRENEHDKVKYLHVSRSFLNVLSSIPSPLTPGSRNWLYCKAFMEIVLMFLLLALVVVIVVSYGNATDLSTGMKTLITLGSGALLFLFNILLIRSFSHSSYEDKELMETFARSHVENNIEETWEIRDFDNLSSDNTESNADLYCTFENKNEMLFFTNESLENDDKETKSISVCKIFRRTVCKLRYWVKPSRDVEIGRYYRRNVLSSWRSSYSISLISEDLEHSF